MSKEFGVFSVGDAKEIKRRVLGNDRASLPSVNSSEYQENRYYGVLAENLAAATNPYGGWTSAKVRVLRYSNYIARNMEPATGDNALIEVINRSTSLSSSSGKFVIIEKVGTEWTFIWVDC